MSFQTKQMGILKIKGLKFGKNQNLDQSVRLNVSRVVIAGNVVIAQLSVGVMSAVCWSIGTTFFNIVVTLKYPS